MQSSKYISILLIILLIGTGLRVYGLGKHDLWFDEVWSVVVSSTPEAIGSYMYQQKSPPLFSVLLHFWMKYLGKNETSLRLLPMLFGVLSIAIIYKLGELFLNKKVGLISALIFSISPIHTWYSQEVKAYSLSIFLTILVVYLLFLALEKDKKYLWSGFIIASILGIYTNYFCLFLIPLSSFILFFKRYRYLVKKWAISVFLIIISFLPWSYFLFQEITATGENFWIPRPAGKSIIITFGNFNLGYNATKTMHLFAIILFFFLFILGVIDFKNNREKIAGFLFFLLTPIFTTFLISRYWFSIYLDRQLLLFSPFYYIIVARGIDKIKPILTRAVILIVIFLLMGTSLYNYYLDNMPLPHAYHTGIHMKKPFKPIVQFVKENQKEKDAVFYSHPSIVPSFLFYWRFDEEIHKRHFYLTILSEDSKYWSNEAREAILVQKKRPISYINVITEEDTEDCVKRYSIKRIWLISSSWNRGEILDRHSQAVRDWMDSHYPKLLSQEFQGIWIDLYDTSYH